MMCLFSMEKRGLWRPRSSNLPPGLAFKSWMFVDVSNLSK